MSERLKGSCLERSLEPKCFSSGFKGWKPQYWEGNVWTDKSEEGDNWTVSQRKEDAVFSTASWKMIVFSLIIHF